MAVVKTLLALVIKDTIFYKEDQEKGVTTIRYRFVTTCFI